MDRNPDETLGVQADQHHVLPPEAVREGTEQDPADHHPAEVDGSDQRSHKGSIANQTPLKKK